MEYIFKKGFSSHVDPQLAGEELSRIEQAHGGIQTIVVVEEARSKRSPLHDHFEWNDTIAAHGFRKDQARELIRNIRIVENSDDPKLAFINVDVVDEPQQYRSLNEVLSHGDLWKSAVSSFMMRIESAQRALEELEACAKTKRQKAVVERLVTHLTSAAGMIQ